MIVVPGVLTLRIDVPGALNLGIVVHGDQLEQKKYLKTTKKNYWGWIRTTDLQFLNPTALPLDHNRFTPIGA